MSTVEIKYNGTDITVDVEIATARFSAQVNGNPGTCTFKVRDDGHTYDFVSGGELTLDINSVRVWGGFLTKASRVYPFPAEDTSHPTSRFWEMAGVDWNILFSKRIVFDESDPTGKLSFDYAVGTFDDTIIADIFDNYLPGISGDGLSRSGVERVDIVTLDIKGVTSGKGTLTNGRGQIASAGYTWKQAMDVIARATGAIYYIDPEKVLRYVDVDTADADFKLSDTPSAMDELGYQEFRLLFNGSNLVNDMLVWGAAAGSDRIVFARAGDAASQSVHGTWQGGLYSQGLYRQASANLVAASYIDGTPQSKRGGKDDAISLFCRVFTPSFRVGQKVDTTVDIFGYHDTLPIRRMDVRFINGSDAIFDLTLSHDIDQPWSIFESLFPTRPGVKVKPVVVPPIIPGPPACPPLCEHPTYDADLELYSLTFPYTAGGLSATLSGDPITLTETDPVNGTFEYPGGDQSADIEVCYVPVNRFDNFRRVEASDFGQSDFGLNWSTQLSDGSIEVNGSQGELTVDVSAGPPKEIRVITEAGGPWINDSWTMTMRFVMSSDGDLIIGIVNPDSGGPTWVDLNAHDGLLSGPAGTDSTAFSWLGGQEYYLKWQMVAWPSAGGKHWRAKVWEIGDPEPSTWNIEDTGGTQPNSPSNYLFIYAANVNVSDPFQVVIEWIDFDYDGKPCFVDCGGGGSEVVDDFERTEAPDGWGQASSGPFWDYGDGGPSGGTVIGVDSGSGYMEIDHFSGNSQILGTPAGMASPEGFVMHFRFKSSDVPDSGSDAMLLDIEDYDNPDVSILIAMGNDESTAGSEALGLDVYGGSGAHTHFDKFDWLADTWYVARWEFRPLGTNALTIWVDGDPEPEANDVEVANVDSDVWSGTLYWSMNHDADSIAGTVTMRVDDISFGGGCTDVLPGSGLADVGWVCEDPAYTDGTTYQLTNSFIAASQEVYVNHEFQRPGIAREYTTDPVAGQIVFNDPLASDDEVRVCYNANGRI